METLRQFKITVEIDTNKRTDRNTFLLRPDDDEDNVASVVRRALEFIAAEFPDAVAHATSNNSITGGGTPYRECTGSSRNGG